MQHLNMDFIKEAKKVRMQSLEKDLRETVLSYSPKETFICPICNYSSRKNPKGSAKRFQDSFKCFSCGVWRKI